MPDGATSISSVLAPAFAVTDGVALAAAVPGHGVGLLLAREISSADVTAN